MKKEIIIEITDDSVTLDGNNLEALTEKDIIDSIKILVSLAKITGILQKEGPLNGNAQVHR